MIIYLVAILIVVLNIVVTIHVIRDSHRRGYEKAAETGLIWVLPLFGALVSLCITFQGPTKVRQYENVMKFFNYTR